MPYAVELVKTPKKLAGTAIHLSGSQSYIFAVPALTLILLKKIKSRLDFDFMTLTFDQLSTATQTFCLLETLNQGSAPDPHKNFIFGIDIFSVVSSPEYSIIVAITKGQPYPEAFFSSTSIYSVSLSKLAVIRMNLKKI
ncbi:hypothetical protein BpHYR1_003365 [Brachionus plicatilis]|uniref:Uncharacterized protein n=1 Tax=Brachionus plicatilis TaxID=10195 RepID=A0A3M7SIV7_BRAPC|nr:hypothetical protein BpHYR1_003365 [Brachionus plicatilis]